MEAYRIDECGRMIADSEPDEDSWTPWVAAQSELTALKAELASEEQDHAELRDVVAKLREENERLKSESFEGLYNEAIGNLDALREELRIANEYCDSEQALMQAKLTAAEQRNAELQKQLDSIDKHLRGNVNDPDHLPPIMPGAASYTTTYGLVAGLRRERDYLKKSTTPLPAGDDYLRQLAQRLREYIGNPHHIDPVSDAFKRLIDDSAFALSKAATALAKPTESGASE